MGVRGSGGVGGGVSRARPSHIAYYVALAGILALLALLLLYFFYFFITKVKKLSSMESQTQASSSCRPPAVVVPAAYPVQPVVREGASEMAKLCKQVPPGKGGTVFPTSTSPTAIRTDTGDALPDAGAGAGAVPGPLAPEPLAPGVVPGAVVPPTSNDAPVVTGDAALLKPPPPAPVSITVQSVATQ